MSNSPEARGLEPCLEHPDYIPPFKGKPIHFEDPQQSTVVGLLEIVSFLRASKANLTREKRLEDSIGEQYENSTSKRDSN